MEIISKTTKTTPIGNVKGFVGRIGNVISIFGGAIEDEFLNLMEQ